MNQKTTDKKHQPHSPAKKDWSKINSQVEELEKTAASKSSKQTKADVKKAKTVPADYTELEEKLTAAEQKISDYWNQLLEVRADMENLHRRTERDIANAHKYALDKFVDELLPVVDNLERSLEVKSEDDELFKTLREGVEMTLKIFLAALQKFGVEQIDPVNKPFDPNFHEALSMQKAPDVAPNTVIQVIQKGYSLNERLVRPARVIVSG